MRSIRLYLALLFFSSGIMLLSTCKKEGDENKLTKIEKTKLSGYVQKGPYINGTSILMYELDGLLVQTGKNFSTQISNNKGSFEILSVTLSSQYVELLANGYYFNEVAGDISSAPLSLYALSDITDLSTVNVNILTHLENGRVMYLVGNGVSFAAAKDTAQKEVLAIFGFQSNNMDRSEELDMSVDKQENGILIAISVILQGNRSVGDLTELLANISTDIRLDGKLDDKVLLTNLKRSTLELDLVGIRSNLQRRYNELGYTTTIPDFETYINSFLADIVFQPTATTLPAANILTSSATLRGTINANNQSTSVTFEYGTTRAYGTKVSSTQNPITGHSNQSVSADISELTFGTKYYARVDAVNSVGTTYGNEIIFTTQDKGTVDDIEGNVYKTVKIDNQIWMAENLRATKFNDNTEIPLVISNDTWATSTTPSYCWYNNDISFKDNYGALYNWYTVDNASNGSKNVCPIGWHVPSDSEWTTLTDYLRNNGYGYDGIGSGIAKSMAATIGWNTIADFGRVGNDQASNNSSGFTAQPTGQRWESGSFGYFGVVGWWWCSSEGNPGVAWDRGIEYGWFDIGRYIATKEYGYSVRCLKDD